MPHLITDLNEEKKDKTAFASVPVGPCIAIVQKRVPFSKGHCTFPQDTLQNRTTPVQSHKLCVPSNPVTSFQKCMEFTANLT